MFQISCWTHSSPLDFVELRQCHQSTCRPCYPTHEIKKMTRKILKQKNDKLKVQSKTIPSDASPAWPEFIKSPKKVSIGKDLLLFTSSKLFFSALNFLPTFSLKKFFFVFHFFYYFIVPCWLSGCKSSGSNQIDREMKTR